MVLVGAISDRPRPPQERWPYGDLSMDIVGRGLAPAAMVSPIITTADAVRSAPKPPSDEGGGTAQAVTEGEKQEGRNQKKEMN